MFSVRWCHADTREIEITQISTILWTAESWEGLTFLVYSHSTNCGPSHNRARNHQIPWLRETALAGTARVEGRQSPVVVQ